MDAIVTSQLSGLAIAWLHPMYTAKTRVSVPSDW